MREIEIKVRARNLSEVEKKLLRDGCILSDEISQRDVVYSKDRSVWRDSTKGDAVVRIRRTDKGAEFNFKKQCSNESDNIEYETGISDPEEMHNILLALGWQPQVEVVKVRQKGMLDKYEICLDKVEKLGTFVELEKLTKDDDDPKEVRKELFKVLSNYGFSPDDEEVRGYDTMIFLSEHSKTEIG